MEFLSLVWPYQTHAFIHFFECWRYKVALEFLPSRRSNSSGFVTSSSNEWREVIAGKFCILIPGVTGSSVPTEAHPSGSLGSNQ